MAQANNRKAELEDQASELATLPEALMRQFSELAMMLPETESDGGASIIQAVLNTVDVQGLDNPWDAKEPEKLCGEWLIITEASRSISTYAEGLGVFLVVTAVREDSGEEIVFTTGSMAVVAQIVRAYTIGAIPLRAKMLMAERASKKGYFPMHLEIAAKQPGR